MLSSILFILAASWLGLLVVVYVFQSRLIYIPHKSVNLSPADIGLPYEDVYLQTQDGLTLHAWFVPHEQPLATLLFFHGNAGNISHRLDSIQIFNQLGLSVLIVDYRGYGLSEGKPGEQGSYKDARAAWTHLLEVREVPAQQIVIFGRSLGGGVASWLAAQEQAGALILESSFTSIPDIGAHYYPYLPVSLLARIRYPSSEHLKQVNSPVLVVHSPEDDIIPYEFGQRLYSAAKAPKSFLEISGGHNEGFFVSGEKYKMGIREFIVESIAK